LSDGVTLPAEVGRRLLAGALAPDGDGRVSLDLGQGSFRATVAFVGGAVGAWVRPGKPAEEAKLRTALPVDHAVYLGSQEILGTQVTGKFRNFFPFATESGHWEMWTKAEKAKVREVILNPPSGLWCLGLGDGQKHVAIHTPLSFGAPRELQSVCLEGRQVDYLPSEMTALVDAVEVLVLAGALDEEIRSGIYSRPSGLDWRRSYNLHEPTIRKARGHAPLDLAIWLRRSAAALREEYEARKPSHEVALAERPEPPREPAPVAPASPRPADGGGRPPIGRQLSLFG
jgi:hypothetical protein